MVMQLMNGAKIDWIAHIIFENISTEVKLKHKYFHTLRMQR